MKKVVLYDSFQFGKGKMLKLHMEKIQDIKEEIERVILVSVNTNDEKETIESLDELEELLKAIPIIYFGFVISDKRADLLTVSMALGIGFAILENCYILVANLDQTSIIWAFTRGFSSALLHVGTWHIVSNITATLIVGWAVESQLGTAKTALCYIGATFVSGLYMAFVYKLHEGEGASTGIYGLIAVFVMLAIKNGTVFFSPVPAIALIVLAIYTIGGMLVGKATAFEHISGFVGGLLMGLVFVVLM